MIKIPSGDIGGAMPSGIVEFQSNAVPPQPPLFIPHQNIEFPSLVNPIIAHSFAFDGNGDSANPLNITSFSITVEGDYLIGFYGTTKDNGSNLFSIALWSPLTTITPGTAGTVTGTLTNFTLPFSAGTQGTETKELSLIGVYHLAVGEQISLVNVGASAANLDSNVSSATTTAGITFELLRAGPAVTGP